jgi:hypothetical protein
VITITVVLDNDWWFEHTSERSSNRRGTVGEGVRELGPEPSWTDWCDGPHAKRLPNGIRQISIGLIAAAWINNNYI